MGAYASFSPDAPSGAALLKPNTDYSSPTGSILPHVLLCIAQPATLVSPPFPGRGALFSAGILLLVFWSHANAHFSNDPGITQAFALLWPNYLGVIEKLLFSGPGGPELRFWRIDKPAHEATGYAPLGWQKWRWAAALTVNLRGVRWNWQVKNVPAVELEGAKHRRQFLVGGLWRTLYYFLAADTVNQLWIHLFYTPRRGQVGVVDSKYLTLRDEDWKWRIVKSWLWGQLPYFFINFQYAVGSVVFVGLGISRPELYTLLIVCFHDQDWPPIFGPLSAATTVRNFWGVFWQQIGRRVFSVYPQHLLATLSIPRGTIISSYGQLWAGFALSAIFHAQTNRISVSPANITSDEKIWGILWFFFWQALAITAEDISIWSWSHISGNKEVNEMEDSERNRQKGRDWKCVTGYVWVCWSFYVSMPFAADVLLRMRTAAEPMLPFSVVAPIVEQRVGKVS